jgi:hypothetical protein
MWIVTYILMPTFSSSSPKTSNYGHYGSFPGSIVKLDLGRVEVEAINKYYHSRLIRCNFLPNNNEQRNWRFNPISFHHEKSEIGIEKTWENASGLSGSGYSPIDVTHTVTLANREELWGQNLLFKIKLLLEWPQQIGQNKYKKQSKEKSWYTTITVPSKQFVKETHNKILYTLVALFPFYFILGSFVSNSAVKRRYSW